MYFDDDFINSEVDCLLGTYVMSDENRKLYKSFNSMQKILFFKNEGGLGLYEERFKHNFYPRLPLPFPFKRVY